MLVHELASGKSEIRVRPPDGVSNADLLRVAIRKLEDAVAIFEQPSGLTDANHPTMSKIGAGARRAGGPGRRKACPQLTG